jgi:hypothetical protein
MMRPCHTGLAPGLPSMEADDDVFADHRFIFK